MDLSLFFKILYDFFTYWIVYYVLGFSFTNYYSKKIYGATVNNISLWFIPKHILWLIRPSWRGYNNNVREKPSLKVGCIYQVAIFTVSTVCLCLLIISMSVNLKLTYAILNLWQAAIFKIFIICAMFLVTTETFKLCYIIISENILGRSNYVKESKTWRLNIDDTNYTITFIKDYWWRGYRLDINGEIIPLYNSPYENITGLDIPINIGEHEGRFYRSSRKTGSKMDIVYNGYLLESGEKYNPSNKKPFLYFILKNRWRENHNQ